MSAEMEEKNFPERNEHLLQWAQKEYGAVTSFTELKVSRNIYIKVGEGKSNKKKTGKQNSTEMLELLNLENKFHCSISLFFDFDCETNLSFSKEIRYEEDEAEKIRCKDQTLGLVSFLMNFSAIILCL